jgi:hypothetical protein
MRSYCEDSQEIIANKTDCMYVPARLKRGDRES